MNSDDGGGQYTGTVISSSVPWNPPSAEYWLAASRILPRLNRDDLTWPLVAAAFSVVLSVGIFGITTSSIVQGRKGCLGMSGAALITSAGQAVIVAAVLLVGLGGA